MHSSKVLSLAQQQSGTEKDLRFMNDDAKKRSAERAIEFVSDDQVVGLGTGSTARFAIEGLARRVREGLRIKGVPTSIATAQMARERGIALADLNEIPSIDITIDGADEVDDDFNMIKGGGGALTREKLVALASARSVIIVDETKLVKTLGAKWPVPVEVLPFAWRYSSAKLEALGSKPTLRLKDEKPFETDNGNYILDCQFGPIADAAALEKEMKLVPGVVECGLFIAIANLLVIGSDDRVEIKEK
ncbi:MAG TPA: ribose-5-phosphate isomerase RpiA [Blastocatellia bacterium]|nr:ribose-5-phosphate isomerase RpiA [Blastocatellia bacterium]